MTDNPITRGQAIDQAAQAAFFSDVVGGHIRGNASWGSIPQVGRDNYRTLVTEILNSYESLGWSFTAPLPDDRATTESE